MSERCRFCKFAATTLLLAIILVPSCALAQLDTKRAQDWVDREKRAVVKLEVTGTTPDGRPYSQEGSGFFIYSGGGTSYLITAAHVIGSNEAEQTKNPDWKVENGTIQRTIGVRPLNEHGTLDSANTDVSVADVYGGDIAVLAMNGDGYQTLPLNVDARATDLRQVMLLGFRAQSRTLTKPPPIGLGQLDAATSEYLTNFQSWPGESGAPLIDLETGKAVAIATGTKFRNGPSNQATPISLHAGNLAAFLPVPPSTPAPLPAADYQARGDREALQYRAAIGSLEKLKSYVSSCTICQFKEAAQSEIASLERQAQSGKEEAQYRAAHGSVEKLGVYLASCLICEFKAQATAEISERRTQSVAEEKQYDGARGNPEGLKAYVDTCKVCQFKKDALDQIATLNRPQQRQKEDTKRFALVIGNYSYVPPVGQLLGPPGDLKLISKALKDVSFNVTSVQNAGRIDFVREISRLGTELAGAGDGAIGFLYYSGHGAVSPTDHTEYLIPIDVGDPANADFFYSAVPLSEITAQLTTAAPKAAIFIVFDACRYVLQLPKKSEEILAPGFIRVSFTRLAPENNGTFIAFANAANGCGPDVHDVAGPYAESLALELVKPGQDHLELFSHVRERVRRITNGVQVPSYQDNLVGQIYFAEDSMVQKGLR